MTDPLRLRLVVCGAGPASHLPECVRAGQARNLDVHVVATPAALDFIDTDELQALTGHPVRHSYRDPREPGGRSPSPDMVVVAPATYNTINKLAAGISDNYALNVLAEHLGRGIPIVVLPFINDALANRLPLRRSVSSLREEGVRVLLGLGGFQPHPPGTGDSHIPEFPWESAVDTAIQMTSERAKQEP
jgi:phosphopantothenoylcysteine synthetase/decarboxylase